MIVVKRTTVNVGEEAVVIKKPWFLGKSGIESKPITTGTIWAVASTEIKIISLKAFNIEESFNSLFTHDYIPINFNIYMTFRYKKGKSVLLVKEFGSKDEWYQHLLSKPLQKSIEMEVKQRTLLELSSDPFQIEELKNSIIFGVEDFIKKQNIPVELLTLNISKISPPQALIDMALKKEIAKNERERQTFKKEAEEIAIEADRAYMLRMNMTPRQYLELKRIELDNRKLSNQRFAIDSAKDSNGSIKININIGR